MKKALRLLITGNNYENVIRDNVRQIFENLDDFVIFPMNFEGTFFNKNIDEHILLESTNTVIANFLKTETKGIDKCIFIYNYEYAPKKFHSLLRDFMENYQDVVFIIICDSIERIPEYVQYRMFILHYSEEDYFANFSNKLIKILTLNTNNPK